MKGTERGPPTQEYTHHDQHTELGRMPLAKELIGQEAAHLYVLICYLNS